MSYSTANRDKQGNLLAPPAAPQAKQLVPSRYDATAEQRQQLYERVTAKIMAGVNSDGDITVDVRGFSQFAINEAILDIKAAGWHIELGYVSNDIVLLELS